MKLGLPNGSRYEKNSDRFEKRYKNGTILRNENLKFIVATVSYSRFKSSTAPSVYWDNDKIFLKITLYSLLSNVTDLWFSASALIAKGLFLPVILYPFIFL